MSNFQYLTNRGSLAKWATGTTVSSAEFWFFESSIIKCPNFADGGTYAPVAAVIVGGAGMTVTGPFEASAATEITVTDSLTTDATSIVEMLGDVTVGSSAANTLIVNASTSFNETVSIAAPLTMATGGKIRKRRLTITSGLPADNLVNAAAYDIVTSGTSSLPEGAGIRISSAPYADYELTVCNRSGGVMIVELGSELSVVSLPPETTGMFLSQAAAPGWILIWQCSNVLA